MAALYDGLRVDHVIGVYRTYGRVPGADPFFSPPDEPSQIAQGEAVLREDEPEPLQVEILASSQIRERRAQVA